MHIIIDGYNFIGRYSGLRGDIEGKREALINLLCEYKALRGHYVTVVFDGWQNGMPEETAVVTRGVEVIFSRLGEKADDVIKRLSSIKNQSMVVVSSDRDVSSYALKMGAVAISCGEFEKKLVEISHFKQIDSDSEDKGIYSSNFMSTKKKGNPRRPSKKERKKMVRMKKM